MTKWIKCNKVSSWLATASTTASVTRAPYLIKVGLCPSRGPPRARFLWKRSGCRVASREAHAPDRSLKWHSQARIASLETPNHVVEYIIRLLSAVQLRARTCNQCRSSLVNARETSRSARRIPSIIPPDRETLCHKMSLYIILTKRKFYNFVAFRANL